MGRKFTFALATIALISIPVSASAVQTVVFEGAVAHTQADAPAQSLGTAGVPADMTTPDNFAGGMLHHRINVTTAPTLGATYGLCFVQGAQRACSSTPIAISAAGSVEMTESITGFSNYANIQWNMAMDGVEVVVMDTAGEPVDPATTTWIGQPDLTMYYPLDGTYEAVVVAQGDTFEGYPSDNPGNMAEAPTMSPNGGTFEGSVSVTLGTGSADSTIYYTTDGSDPSDTSTAFDGTPIDITTTTTIRAITYATGLDPSTISSATFTIVDQLSNGLRGRYFDNTDFSDLVATRTDPTIDFVWDGNAPFGDLGGDWAILWSGQITPRYTDTYTIKTVNDDGVRLWVNNQLLIDDWTGHGPLERTGTITLTADQPVSIWLEYYNGGGPGTISLGWESPQQPNELIPDTAMVPDLPAGTDATVSLFGGEIEVFENDAEPRTLELRRRGSIDTAVTVNLTIEGDATQGSDYQLDSTTVNFPAGALSARVQLTVNDDADVEGPETITLTVADGDGYTVGNPSTATITIQDDDVLVDSITGSIIYSGTESGNIIVEAFRETDPAFAKRAVSLLNPGEYMFTDLEEGDYTVIAFIDADDDGQLDEDEIWGVYSDAQGQPALVTIPPGQVGIDINLDVPPGQTAGDEDDGGCCTTLAGRRTGTSGWLAMLMGAALLGLRRRRR